MNIAPVKAYNELVYYIMELQQIYGLRISEVLGLKESDRIAGNSFYCKILKNGVDKVIIINNIDRILKLSNATGGFIFGSVNSTTVHRCCLKFGLFINKAGRKRRATTHVFRNEFANKIHTQFNDVNITKDLLSHKSKKSQEYYVKFDKNKK